MKHILVIDDDDLVRDTIVETLIQEGYLVKSAKDGVEGLQTIRGEHFDLIITDLYMPEKEGMQTIIEIRRDFPKMKILAISGRSDAMLNVARLLGSNSTLGKPFDLGELASTVEQLLEG